MNRFLPAVALLILLAPSAKADLVLFGVMDGDLSGGLPKAIVVLANADISDLSIYGLGSATNGGGSGGQEFTFSGSALAGDKLIVASSMASLDFFNDFFRDISVVVGGVANINGDDAVELFESSSVIDTYGDVNVDGTGQSWEYEDGYAVRTGGSAGSFSEGNYDIQKDAFDGLDEAGHQAAIANVFGFTAVPEPSGLLLMMGPIVIGLGRRRDRRLRK